MKLIDFGVIFAVVFICISTIWDFKNDMLYRNKINSVMFNDAVDEIVIDSLNLSYSVNEDEIYINKEQLIKCYQSEMSILCSGTNILKNYYDNNSILIVTEKDGFYLWEEGCWCEKIYYSKQGSIANGGIINSDNPVHVIEATIEERYNVTLTMASKEGESFKNNISENSFVVVYIGKEHRIADNKYQVVFVSGASIKVK